MPAATHQAGGGEATLFSVSLNFSSLLSDIKIFIYFTWSRGRNGINIARVVSDNS